MARRSHTLPLLLVALVLAGALVVVGGGLLETSPLDVGSGEGWEASQPAPTDARVPGAPGSLDAAAGPTSAPDPAAPGAAQEAPSAELELVVVDGDGRKFETVKITLVTPAGEQIERTEPGLLMDLEPGVWTVVARSQSLLPAQVAIELTNGRRRRVVLELLNYMRISGRLLNDHGEPLVREPIFLLASGEPHPPSNSTALARTSGTTATRGEFHMRVPGPGAYRFSVGPPGTARWQQPEAFQLGLTGPRYAEIIIPSEGRLVVRMAQGSGAEPAAHLDLQIEAKQSGSVVAAASIDPALLALGYGEEQTAAPTRPVGLASRGSSGNAFIRWQTVPLRGAGETPVEHSPTDRELRLALTYRGQRHESDRTFQLAPGATNRITILWPTEGAESKPLKFAFEHLPPPAHLPKVGCTWIDG